MGIERAVLDLDVMAIELLHYAVRWKIDKAMISGDTVDYVIPMKNLKQCFQNFFQ